MLLFHSVFPRSPQVKGFPLLCSGIKVWYLLVMKEPTHKNWLKFPGGWLLTLPFPWLYFPSELAWHITVLIQLQKGTNCLLMEAHKFSHVIRRGIFTRNELFVNFELHDLKGDGEIHTVYIHQRVTQFSSVQSSSCVWLCSSTDCSMPGFPVHLELLACLIQSDQGIPSLCPTSLSPFEMLQLIYIPIRKYSLLL